MAPSIFRARQTPSIIDFGSAPSRVHRPKGGNPQPNKKGTQLGAFFHIQNRQRLLRLEIPVNRQHEEHHVRRDHLDAEVHQLALTEDHVHHHKHRGDADEVGDEDGFGHVDASLPRGEQQDANHEEGVSDAHMHVGGQVNQVVVAVVRFGQGHFAHGGRKKHGHAAYEGLVHTKDGECG